jgi:hypothetical protein
MQNNIPRLNILEIHCCIVKGTNLSTILPFSTKNVKKLKIRNIVLSWQRLSASLRAVLAISTYFILLQCLENVGKGLLHACVSSFTLSNARRFNSV